MLRGMAGRDSAGLVAESARWRRSSTTTTATRRENTVGTRFLPLSERRAIVRIWTTAAGTIVALTRARAIAVVGMLVAASASLHADFTYTETTQITGGSMLGLMKMAGAFSKDARKAGEPIVSTVAIKGNRMAHVNPTSTEIIDLDAETITTI